MYSYEIDQCFKENNYRFQRFCDFNNIVECSPQVRYTLTGDTEYETFLHVFTDDDWCWDIVINCEHYFFYER